MFTKKNYILFLILIVLAAGAWAYTVPLQNWREEQSNSDSTNFLGHVDIGAVDRIEVTRPDEDKTYTITRSNGAWLMQPGDLPTEQILMDALEEKMAAIAAGEFQIASLNADNQPNFGITADAPHVALYQGQDEVASFIIGNVASDYQSAYIGRENDPNTYRIPTTLVRAFDVTSWQLRSDEGE